MTKSETPTVREMEKWGAERVLGWIQGRNLKTLTENDVDNFEKANFPGGNFLQSDFGLFRKCGITQGASQALANLVKEIKENDKSSDQTAGSKRTVDETDAPESPTSPKRYRLNSEIDGTDDTDDDLVLRVERAVERRTHILQEIKATNQLLNAVPLPNAAVQPSNAAVQPSNAAIQPSNAAVQLSNAAVALSSPATQTNLPFPFVGDSLPGRFKYDGDHSYWNYMGREKFTELLGAVNQLETTSLKGYLFYGTIGYGKSHLLAALACYLIATGKRVVYLPDCRDCAWNPVTYIRAAMLLTWGGPDDSVIRESITALNTMKSISNFFGRQSNVLFIVDQLNSLEKDANKDPFKDTLSDEMKDHTYGWIMKCVSRHKYIFSASANNQNRGWRQGRVNNTDEILVYNGFSAVEMQQWWGQNKGLIPNCYTKEDEIKDFKSKVEDLTGCIPLLLNDCVVNGKIDLSADALEEIATQVQAFMERIKRAAKAPSDWDTHCEYVRACINGHSVRKTTPLDLIDNRYFYSETDSTGKYACGIAREAAARQLRRYKMDKFGDTDFLTALNDYIGNPSVTGFFIEQAVLSSIALRGLEIAGQISKRMDTVIFDGIIPNFHMTEGDPVLYCPINYNYRGIDGIIIRFTEGTCYMFPLQITIAKSHSDSEEKFFREWSKWTNKLTNIKVDLTFIWITKEDSELKLVDEEHRSTKSGDKIIHPSYYSQKIPLKSVSLDIWERYQQALGRSQENLKGWVEDECLGDDQAPLDATATEKVGGKPEWPEELEGPEEQASLGGPSATARPSAQEAKKRGGKKEVPKPRTGTGRKTRLIDQLEG